MVDMQLEKYCEESGYTINAVRIKIKRNIWVEGKQWNKAPYGHIMIDPVHGELVVCHNLDVFRSLVMDLVQSMMRLHEGCTPTRHSFDQSDSSLTSTRWDESRCG